mgnify:CR=1 FL=1
MKKVNKLQIDRLYKFTSQHYVEYYDIQTELVDHLANGIEKTWEEFPEMDFEKALTIEFKRFGVFGFMEVLDKRIALATKRYYRLIAKETLEFLKSGKAVFSILVLSILFFAILRTSYGLDILMSLIFLELVLLMVMIALKKRRYEKKLKSSHKKRFLLEEVIVTAGHSASLFPLVISFFNLISYSELNMHQSLFMPSIIAVICALQLVLVYIAYFHIPEHKEEILAEAYSELQML